MQWSSKRCPYLGRLRYKITSVSLHINSVTVNTIPCVVLINSDVYICIWNRNIYIHRVVRVIETNVMVCCLFSLRVKREFAFVLNVNNGCNLCGAWIWTVVGWFLVNLLVKINTKNDVRCKLFSRLAENVHIILSVQKGEFCAHGTARVKENVYSGRAHCTVSSRLNEHVKCH